MKPTGYQIFGWKKDMRIKRGQVSGTLINDGVYESTDREGTWWFWIHWDTGRKERISPWVGDRIIEI